jgi:ribosomal protein S18 acetylase RimI-like enzyme
MLVRNVFENDFLAIVEKSKVWGDIVIERDTIYHVLTRHFRNTCFIAEDHERVIGYLLGFRSQAYPEEAYMNLVQVDPALRGHGVGRRLFSQFEAAVKAMGCRKIVTTSRPQNKTAAKFYEEMGFKPVATDNMIEVDGVKAIKDYNGPGKHVVLWDKDI